MAGKNPPDDKSPIFSEDDLKNFTQDPFIDYATGEIVDERVIRYKTSYEPHERENAERAAQWLIGIFGKYLKNYKEFTALEVVDRIATDKAFERRLISAFELAGYVLKPELKETLTGIWGPHLPVAAPRLWENRSKATESNPADFIRAVYGEWLPHLARQDIKHFDHPLYVSYAQWVRPERHPEDKVDFAEGYGKARIKDSDEAIERRRASARATTARRREKQRNGQNAAGVDGATVGVFGCAEPKFE